MQVASGTVVDGKVVVEGLSLPEGTVVTVLARGEATAVRLPPQQEAELLEALECRALLDSAPFASHDGYAARRFAHQFHEAFQREQ